MANTADIREKYSEANQPPIADDKQSVRHSVDKLDDLHQWDKPNPNPYPGRQTDWQNQSNNWCRWIDDAKFTGGWAQLAVATEDLNKTDADTDSNVVGAQTQVEVLTGSAVGMVTGTIIHWMVKNRYSNKRSLNPLYRTFKTLASVGASLGTAVGYILPLPKNGQKIVSVILADIFSMVFGLVSLPYWLVRENWMNSPEQEKNKKQYVKTGNEGWSKYGKTLLVYFTAAGQLLGALHSHLAGTNLMADIAIGGGISGVAAFFTGLVLVPVINRYFNKALITDKNTFRNNYVRTGIVAGSALGSSIGFVLGTIVFPGLGSMAGMAIGGAIGGLIGGAITGVTGKKISQAAHPEAFHPTNPRDNENSWDYVTRGTAYIGASIGAVIGIFAPVPGGALVGAALGAAIGSVIGWVGGFGVIKAARYISPIEKPANSLPWTQRVATGSNVFSMVGSVIFCIAGFVMLGPIGALVGAALGYAIGGLVGNVVGYFYDPKPKPKLDTHSIELDPIKPLVQVVCEKAPENEVKPVVDNNNRSVGRKYESSYAGMLTEFAGVDEKGSPLSMRTSDVLSPSSLDTTTTSPTPSPSSLLKLTDTANNSNSNIVKLDDQEDQFIVTKRRRSSEVSASNLWRELCEDQPAPPASKAYSELFDKDFSNVSILSGKQRMTPRIDNSLSSAPMFKFS